MTLNQINQKVILKRRKKFKILTHISKFNRLKSCVLPLGLISIKKIRGALQKRLHKIFRLSFHTAHCS